MKAHLLFASHILRGAGVSWRYLDGVAAYVEINPKLHKTWKSAVRLACCFREMLSQH